MRTSLTSMKLLTIGIAMMGSGTLLNSQDTVVTDETVIVVPLEGSDLGSTAAERLTTLRAINVQLLKKQEVTLEKLEKLEREAEQLRIFSKRS